MRIKTTLWIVCLALCTGRALAAEPPEHVPGAPAALTSESIVAHSESFLDRASRGAGDLMNSGLQYLGIRYRFGGNSAETGFDCSGLVRRVFMDALGLNLPRTAKEMANTGERINPSELKPGDLVFFNTMRRTFSHVGIYLGDNRFLHSPSAGGKVRVESMSDDYWRTRFNGARRVVDQPELRATDTNIR